MCGVRILDPDPLDNLMVDHYLLVMENFRSRPRMKRSVIYSIDDEAFRNLVISSQGMSQVLANFGMRNVGGNHHTVKRRIKELAIDISHFDQHRKRLQAKKRVPLVEKLTENSTFSRAHVKSHIIKEKVIPYLCKECGQGPEWQGKQLVLILDHKNGVHNDNRLENLRFLCPNCNAQQPTFAGKNKRR